MSFAKADVMTKKVRELQEQLAKAQAELEDWRASAKLATLGGHGDEKHCACVGPLRYEFDHLRREVLALAYDKGSLDAAFWKEREAKLAAMREADRLRHNVAVEGDFVCPDATDLEAERHANRALGILFNEAKSVLRWVANNYRATLAGKSVRDADECLEAARLLENKGNL